MSRPRFEDRNERPGLRPPKRRRTDADPHNPPPSKVVHVRGLSDRTVERDISDAVREFGRINYIMMFPNAPQALVEFANVNDAKDLVAHSQNKQIYIGRQVALFNFSTSDQIKRPTGLDEERGESNNVLLLSVQNPLYPITTDIIHKIVNPHGRVLRVVIFKKNGVQAMVEFDTLSSAARVKDALQGADIYSGCCTLKIEYAKPTKLNVHRNDTETWDYTLQPARGDGGRNFSPSHPNFAQAQGGHNFPAASGQQNFHLFEQSFPQVGGNFPPPGGNLPPPGGNFPPNRGGIMPLPLGGYGGGYDRSNEGNRFNNDNPPMRRDSSHHDMGGGRFDAGGGGRGGERFGRGGERFDRGGERFGRSGERFGRSGERFDQGGNGFGKGGAGFDRGGERFGRGGERFDRGRERFGGVIEPEDEAVMMVYGLDMEKMNCQRVFNIFCLYGDVLKIKYLKSKEGSLMIQMRDKISVNRTIHNLNNSKLHGNNIKISSSKQPYLNDVAHPFDLPDQSASFANYTSSKHHRYSTPQAISKNRVQAPSEVLFFWYAPPGISEDEIIKVFEDNDATPPKKVKVFDNQSSERSASGLIEFGSDEEALAALALVNHAEIASPSGKAPYTMKLCFSTSSQLNRGKA